MYIEKIKIDKFRVLEDIEIHFQQPGGATADPETGNVVNVVAGVNGTGKTSLLEAIYDFGNGNAQESKKVYFFQNKIDSKIFYAKTQVPLRYESYDVLSDSTPVEVYHKALNAGISDILQINGLLQEVEEWIKTFVIDQERKVFDSDPKKRTALAIHEFGKIFEGLDILSKLVDLDGAINRNRPLFENIANKRISIEKLSDGEKQIYGCVIRLMIQHPENAVILIDEPEIALHPAWQQKIMQIYSRIGKNNQFIVATHSPQIIASVPYKNRILLRKENGKIQYFDTNQPPSGLDVNSVLSEIMGADPIPKDVLKARQDYRIFVESGRENSEDGLKKRDDLLKLEGGDSRFMQEMAFLIELRDVV
ncbi:MAG: hypothetical protein BWK73_53345 [Thiothrix lacustris]|uniref:AAA+ ATPase domain-containing protein n=1 Tax=Thiothrix lacustris TaxID=525917 RepID=A0A1Y1Q787_9GAMM|nr:MAG: hypothetical protein BWK73_53345 [Thiothrix lacustris]